MFSGNLDESEPNPSVVVHREDPRIGRRFGSIESSELEIEHDEVRKKRSQSLSVPSPDLVGGDVSLQEWISVLASTTKVRS